MNVEWQLSAIRDLRDLREYVAEYSPGAAAAIVARIRTTIQHLEQYPLYGRDGRVIGTRELIVPRTPYIVVYRVKESHVEIHRIRHGAQRWPTHR